MNYPTPFINLRWPTLATLALCMLLPGCPLTDNYFTQSSFAGSGPVDPAGGAAPLSAAGTFATAGLDSGSYLPSPLPSGGNNSDDAGSASLDAGSPGSDAGGSSSVAGASAGNGGSTTTGGSAATGGSSTAGASAAGSSATGGAGDTAGAPSNLPQPACKDGVGKDSPCTAAQLCYNSCGPNKLGFKSETCQSGAYVEQDGCTFPMGQDYSCYKIPSALPAACPAGVPRSGRPCQVAACTLCYGAGAGPQYQDSTGAQKTGYCVCSDAGAWTCGSLPSWPCPDGQGCQ